jgi:hypothetical protein
VDHARELALVRFAGAVGIAVAQTDDGVRELLRVAHGHVSMATLLNAYTFSGSRGCDSFIGTSPRP